MKGKHHSDETKAKLATYTGERVSSYKHGRSATPTWKSWKSMQERCYDPRNSSYKAYGAQGVTVCDRWRIDFLNFLEDMGERPDGMTIDRIDGSGNYEPDNCQWATKEMQTINRRNPWIVRRERYGASGRKKH